MKKFLLIFAMSLFTCNIFPNFAYAGEIYTEPDAIYTRAYNVHFDKQKGLFIIPADKKKYAVMVIFTKNGKIINFNNKVIQYKNGRFSKIGNDYISYLNGKLYTIGGKKVEFGNYGYVNKIGDMTPHQYFIGDMFTQEDVIKSGSGISGMSFFVRADGTDFDGIFSDVSIFFDNVEVSDNSKKEEKKYTGIEEIKHNCTYKGIPLYGRVKEVKNFGDFKVKKVKNFGDIRVRKTDFPNRCGKWQFVDSQENFTIEYVETSEDFKVEFVNSAEGI